MLAKKLKLFREKCDLTQKQMAQALNLERSTYTYYETGKSQPNIDTLKSIAQIFNISVDELLEYKPQPQIFASPRPSYNGGRHRLSSISMLQDDEQNLILRFRQMDEVQKAHVLEMIFNELIGGGE